jgi:hypothetical protein
MNGLSHTPIIIPQEIWDFLSEKTRGELSKLHNKIIAGVYGNYTSPLLIVPRELSDHLASAGFLLTGLMESQKYAKELDELRMLKNSISNLKKHLGDL